jgi:hypothetical protein
VITFDTETACKWDITYLSQPNHRPLAVQVQSKALFASQTKCDIYDFNTGTIKAVNLSMPRRGKSAAGTLTKAFLAGGEMLPGKYTDRIDIYNYADDSWSTGRLSEHRRIGASAGNIDIAVFAGGVNKHGYSNAVDIFNTINEKRRREYLSVARDSMAIGIAASKIVIAGGKTGDIKALELTDKVDIYDVQAGKWSIAKLSEPRYNMAIAVAGNTIVFAGGLTLRNGELVPSDRIDIYNAASGEWRQHILTEPRYRMATVVADNDIYFAGGIKNNGELSDQIDIYDIATNVWSHLKLPVKRGGMAANVANGKVFFAGGMEQTSNQCSDRIDILNIATNTWTTSKLMQARNGVASAAYNNTIIFAGGSCSNNGEQSYLGASAAIDVYRGGNNGPLNTIDKKDKGQNILEVDKDELAIHVNLWRYEFCNVTVNVLNDRHEQVMSIPFLPLELATEKIELNTLPNGCYWLIIESRGFKPMVKRFSIHDEYQPYAANYLNQK